MYQEKISKMPTIYILSEISKWTHKVISTDEFNIFRFPLSRVYYTKWDIFILKKIVIFNVYSCSVNWEEQTFNTTTYIMFLFFFGLAVPVCIITFSYVNIIRTMKQVSEVKCFLLHEFLRFMNYFKLWRTEAKVVLKKTLSIYEKVEKSV